ncbi:hypothetical protein Q9L58_010455, partial [Maublancomyces gigas]
MLMDPNLLTDQLNAVTRHQALPTIWKRARCVPIRKPGRTNLAEPKRLRRISLLSSPGKRFEKIMTKRIAEGGTEMSAITKEYMGLRSGLSATDSLMLSMTQAQEWLDIQGRATKNSRGSEAPKPSMIANDIDRAFNCVNHKRLCDIMRHYR